MVALWLKNFILFLKKIELGTLVCAENESKIKQIAPIRYIRFWDTWVTKTTYFPLNDLSHKW